MLGRDQGFIELATAEPVAGAIDDEEADYDAFQGRILSLSDTRLAFEDVSAIVDELWRRHRGD